MPGIARRRPVRGALARAAQFKRYPEAELIRMGCPRAGAALPGAQRMPNPRMRASAAGGSAPSRAPIDTTTMPTMVVRPSASPRIR